MADKKPTTESASDTSPSEKKAPTCDSKPRYASFLAYLWKERKDFGPVIGAGLIPILLFIVFPGDSPKETRDWIPYYMKWVAAIIYLIGGVGAAVYHYIKYKRGNTA
jgi:hypothetical protein